MRPRSDVNDLYAMSNLSAPLDRDQISALLPAGCLVGRALHVFAETDSTNDLARRAGEAGAAEGLVFFAETQRAGRGRRGRSWASPAGVGLWFSTLLRPDAPRDKWSRLTLLAVRAVLESLARTVGVTAEWKWPNDVMLGTHKLAGILLETTPEFAVLGIGLNVRQRPDDFPGDLRDRAVSVEMITGSGIGREAVASAILATLDGDYRSDWAGGDFGAIRDYCVERTSVAVGSAVRMQSGDESIEGRLVGFTPEAHLRLECAGRVREISEGLMG